MRVYALIPARSGSKGVPHKNILDIAGHPLMAYSIAFAKKIPFERILVSTDSAQYRDIALAYGAECPYLRGANASSDTAMEEDILQDLSENLPRLGISMPDVWVRLKPTNPFRSVQSVEAALAALERDLAIESVRIVSESDPRLWQINDDGFLEPAAPVWDPNRSVMRRGEFRETYKPFNLDIFRHANWLTHGARYMGSRIKPIIEHKVTGIDVDDNDDFQLVAALVTARPRPAFMQPYIHDPT